MSDTDDSKAKIGDLNEFSNIITNAEDSYVESRSYRGYVCLLLIWACFIINRLINLQIKTNHFLWKYLCIYKYLRMS